SGIYKMASSLGNSFGIAISTAIYGTVQLMTDNIHLAGAMGILTAFVFGIISFWVVQKTISPEEGLSDSFEVAGCVEYKSLTYCANNISYSFFYCLKSSCNLLEDK